VFHPAAATMSTSSERARHAADAAKGKKAQSPSGKPAGAEGSATLEERLAAAEAVAAEAAVAAAQAAEAAKAAVAAAAALRKEVKVEAEKSVGSPSPERSRRISPSPERRRQSAVAVAAGALRSCRCTATPVAGGRSSRAPTTTTGVC